MILTRFSDDSTDSLLHHQPTRFADPRLEHCGDSSSRAILTRTARPNDESDSGIHKTLSLRTQRREQAGQQISHLSMQ